MLKLAAFIVAAFFALAGAAFAEPMKLTVNQAFSVSVGIKMLTDGYDHILKDPMKESVVKQHFDFLPGFIKVQAQDASRISDALAPAQKELKAVHDALAPVGKEPETGDARKELASSVEEIGSRLIEIDIIPITYDDLQLDKNPALSAAIVQALLPIIKK
jgi:hypothetical protein